MIVTCVIEGVDCARDTKSTQLANSDMPLGQPITLTKAETVPWRTSLQLAEIPSFPRP